MSISAILTVARRELRAFFDQPTGYILAVVFVGVNDFLFFRTAFLMGSASLRPMMDMLPWLLLFLVPAVTMRSLAEDNRSGAIEVVLSQPLTELEYLIGKYLGQVGFLWIVLALTFPIPILLSTGADMQVGVLVAQYLGAGLLAAGMAAVGVWSSSMTKNQITAFILGVAVMFVLILLGLDPALTGLPPALASAAARLGVLSHFRDIGRGVVDLRDVVYFLTLSAAFLALAYQAILRARLSAKGDARRRLATGTVLVVALAVLVNLFGRQISGRLDLTPGRAYTLSDATREVVREAEDIVTMKLFASREMPPQFSLIRRDIDDLLGDYERAGGGNVRVIEVDPAEDSTALLEAQSLGIPPVGFQTVETSQFSVSEGYLGLNLRYADQTETIPFIGYADDLEYRITTAIRRMTNPDRPTVGIYVAPSEIQLGTRYDQLRAALNANFEVSTLDLASDSIFPEGTSVALLLGSPDSLSAGARAQVEAFLDGGGGVLVGARGMVLQEQFGTPAPVIWNPLIERFGVQVGQNMVYDLGSNEPIPAQTPIGLTVYRSYPLFLRTISTGLSPVNRGVETVPVPWSSTVDLMPEADTAAVTPLLVTSEGAGLDTQIAFLDSERDYAQEGLAQRTIGVLVNPLVGEGEGVQGRAAVFGTAQFLSDNFTSGGPETMGLALNVVDWLAQDEALVSIRSKNRAPPALTFETDGHRNWVKWLNVIGVPLALIAFAFLRLMRRRERSRRPYEAP